MVVLKIHYQGIIYPRSPTMPRCFLQNEYFSSYGQKTPFSNFFGVTLRYVTPDLSIFLKKFDFFKLCYLDISGNFELTELLP